MAEGVDRPIKKRRVLSIRWIVTGATMALTAMAVVGVGTLGERNARQSLTHEIETRLRFEARNLALSSAGALVSEFPAQLL